MLSLLLKLGRIQLTEREGGLARTWHAFQKALAGRQPGNSLRFIAFLSAMFLLWPTSAHAYLDPGTGSYIIQITIAMLVSIGFILKHRWSQLTSFLGRHFAGQAQKDPPKNT